VVEQTDAGRAVDRSRS